MLLSIRDLAVRFRTRSDVVYAVNGVSFDLDRGERLGIVGESGCGKTAASLSIMRLLPQPAGRVEAGSILLEGEDILRLNEGKMRAIRGNSIALIPQDPMTSLNPVLTIEEQLAETIQAHVRVSKSEVAERSVELLASVGIPNPRERLHEYAHEFSGGMRQRVLIAMALALQPKLLIADEPTTALDVTTQAQVLELMRQRTTEASAALILITHNLGVVAGMVDRVNVMYAGVIVETGTTEAIFERPRHPYTIGLLHSIPGGPGGRTQRVPIEGTPPDQRQPPQGCPFAPRCAWRLEICSQQMPPLTRPDGDAVEPDARDVHAFACHNPPSDAEAFAGRRLPELRATAAQPVGANAAQPMGSASAPTATNGHDATPALLRVDGLQVHYRARRSLLGSAGADVRAVDGISFALRRGETLGLVGESGSGKSTTGRAILRLTEPTAGTILLDGTELTSLGVRDLMHARRRMQMIFQDPYASLNPRKTVSSIVREPLDIHAIGDRRERRERARKLLSLVGIDPNLGDRYPHEFSGGQRQRIGVARALALNPDLIVADEPISALDVSMQAQILELLENLQEQLGLTYLFISHDLSVVRDIADRTAVMYLGRIVELAPSAALNAHPLHPYSAALLSAVPVPDPAVEKRRRRIILPGDAPSPAEPPTGCRFHPRCWLRRELGNPGRCETDDPDLRSLDANHSSACHFGEEMEKRSDATTAAAQRRP